MSKYESILWYDDSFSKMKLTFKPGVLLHHVNSHTHDWTKVLHTGIRSTTIKLFFFN